MVVAMLVLTAICAAGSIITSIPVVLNWGGPSSSQSVDAIPAASRSSVLKWWVTLVIGVFGLAGSGVGLYLVHSARTGHIITPSADLETSIENWLDYAELSHADKTKSSPVDEFCLDVSFPNGYGSTVHRPKAHDHELEFEAKLNLAAPDFAEPWSHLSQAQKEYVAADLMGEMARQKMGATFMAPYTDLSVQKVVFLQSEGPGITEQAFFDSLLDMEAAEVLAHTVLRQDIVGKHYPQEAR